MIARAAGDDVHLFGGLEDGRRGRAEGLLEQPAIRDAFLERVRHGARLLVDLLQHEVAVLALLGSIGRQFALAYGALDVVALAIDDAHRGAAHFGHVTLFEEHESARDRQQRGHVRGDEILVHAHADDDRTALAREDDPRRILLADDGERVSALEFGDRGANRLEQIADRLQVMVDPVRDDFGICLGRELVTEALEIAAQFLVILDDAVVHDREAVIGNVRMRVALGRHAVRGPASVRDADLAARGRLVDRILQRLHLADGADALQLVRAVQDGHTGRVIAAVFEAAQSFHQDGDDVALCDGSDDATHVEGPGTLGGASLPDSAAAPAV